MDKSLFVKRTFDVMDGDGSGAIVRAHNHLRSSWRADMACAAGVDLTVRTLVHWRPHWQTFDEFVVALWNYCTLDKVSRWGLRTLYYSCTLGAPLFQLCV